MPAPPSRTAGRWPGGPVQRAAGGSFPPFPAAAPGGVRTVPGAARALPPSVVHFITMCTWDWRWCARCEIHPGRADRGDSARVPGHLPCAGSDDEDERHAVFQGGAARLPSVFPRITPQDFFMRELFIKSFFTLVDQFVCPSHFLRDRYVDWGLPAQKMLVLENGQPAAAPGPARPWPRRRPRPRAGARRRRRRPRRAPRRSWMSRCAAASCCWVSCRD